MADTFTCSLFAKKGGGISFTHSLSLSENQYSVNSHVDSQFTRQMAKDDGSEQQLAMRTGKLRKDLIAVHSFKANLSLIVLFRLNSNNTWLTNFILKLQVKHMRPK
jgi:hypothetical protein